MFQKFALMALSLIFLSNISAQSQFIQTNSIDIETKQKNDNLVIDYTISHTFPSKLNRGIFISLPTFAEGVWLDYSVNTVTKSSTKNIEPIQEPYSIIRERDQFRIRIGDKDTFLDPDTYEYKFQVQTEINPDYNISPILLRDWLDPLSMVSLNGEVICDTQSQCSGIVVEDDLNPAKPEIGGFVKFFNFNRLYFASLFGITIISYILWFVLSRDPKLPKGSKSGTQYEPPEDLYPWQSQFILTEGGVDLKKTLVSYMLWLNHHKYISIKPQTETKKPTIEISRKKDLPTDILPEIFNESIESMIEKGIKKGLKSSKINPEQHGYKLYKHISDSLASKYSKRPLSISAVFGIWFVIGFLLVIGSVITLNILQEPFLIGNSWIGFAVINSFFFLPFLFVILRKWGNLNSEGIRDKLYIKEYRHFIDYVLEEKLDFSNNPRDGVQYYLKNVPYAASFGLLSQFNKYFGKIFPKSTQVNSSGILVSNMNSARYYTPPSSSSSSGGYSGGGGGYSGGGGSW